MQEQRRGNSYCTKDNCLASRFSRILEYFPGRQNQERQNHVRSWPDVQSLGEEKETATVEPDFRLPLSRDAFNQQANSAE
jgi:hypothetical protein